MVTCHFFRLPAELRLQIYSEVLPTDLIICCHPPGLNYISRTTHPNALLFVNHQLHAEYTALIRTSALHSFRLNPMVLHSKYFLNFVAPLLSSIRRVSLDINLKGGLGALSPVHIRVGFRDHYKRPRAAARIIVDAMAASALDRLKVFIALMGRAHDLTITRYQPWSERALNREYWILETFLLSRPALRSFRIYGRYQGFEEHEGQDSRREGQRGNEKGAQWEVRWKCDEPEEPLAERLPHLKSHQYLEDWRGLRYDGGPARWHELARLVASRDVFWERVHRAELSEVMKAYRTLVDATWANWVTPKQIRQMDVKASVERDVAENCERNDSDNSGSKGREAGLDLA
ncbi:hypothetical protein H2201_008092 [Coniosporium apollinis]|uniref:F-box domain-containing protein n=2 Tax=Coniosporium TaxID=2810619 RepID=A0ABQ9NHV5_9PEZI|nr:hypothetical protein H2199_003820 [Cladosporium sp. JES 115]KAJ9657686.1 hypothetical protein H2201_008092 [Coniosporium apollinis]